VQFRGRSHPAQAPSPATSAERTAAPGALGSRWTPNSGDRKEVDGGPCGSSDLGTKKVARGQCEPDPQWPSAAPFGGLCPPDDLARERHPSVSIRGETVDLPEGLNERPGWGPFSAISQGADHGKGV